MKGFDFHRQKPIANYIVDFFCFELMLAIGIDGSSHYGNEINDEIRQKEIEASLCAYISETKNTRKLR